MINRHVLKELVVKHWLLQYAIGCSKIGQAVFSLIARHNYFFAKHLLFCSKHFDRPNALPGFVSLNNHLSEKIRQMGASLVTENLFLKDFLDSNEATSLRKRFDGATVNDTTRLRLPRSDKNPLRQGDLIILKPKISSEEPGVILIKYNLGIASFSATYDLTAISKDYLIVLEPSTWGYQDSIFLNYLGESVRCWVLSQNKIDFDYVESLKANLVPISLGAGDWIDSELFLSGRGNEKIYDVVMVAAWDPLKRHKEFFKAVYQCRKEHGIELNVALIGYPLGSNVEKIKTLAKKNRVFDQCSFFENLPGERVAKIIRESKIGVIWSKREGASKALYEYIFSDVPALVFKDHRGINLRHIVREVGELANDRDLANILIKMYKCPSAYSPRRWALNNTGCTQSTKKLNMILSQWSKRNGLNWSVDLVGKKNEPNLTYTNPIDADRFENEFTKLKDYLL